MRWEVPGTIAEDEFDVGNKPGSLILYRGKKGDHEVHCCVVNHAKRGQWVQIRVTDGTQISQLSNYRDFEQAKLFFIEQTKKVISGVSDKAAVEAAKAEWVKVNGR
eukprot:9030063-Pyramimonas_sp.AAC.1